VTACFGRLALGQDGKRRFMRHSPAGRGFMFGLSVLDQAESPAGRLVVLQAAGFTLVSSRVVMAMPTLILGER